MKNIKDISLILDGINKRLFRCLSNDEFSQIFRDFYIKWDKGQYYIIEFSMYDNRYTIERVTPNIFSLNCKNLSYKDDGEYIIDEVFYSIDCMLDSLFTYHENIVEIIEFTQQCLYLEHRKEVLTINKNIFLEKEITQIKNKIKIIKKKDTSHLGPS